MTCSLHYDEKQKRTDLPMYQGTLLSMIALPVWKSLGKREEKKGFQHFFFLPPLTGH
jgi:hypothetical protein